MISGMICVCGNDCLGSWSVREVALKLWERSKPSATSKNALSTPSVC